MSCRDRMYELGTTPADDVNRTANVSRLFKNAYGTGTGCGVDLGIGVNFICSEHEKERSSIMTSVMTPMGRAAEYDSFWYNDDVEAVQLVPRSKLLNLLPFSTCNMKQIRVLYKDESEEIIDEPMAFVQLDCDALELYINFDVLSNRGYVQFLMPLVHWWNPNKVCEDVFSTGESVSSGVETASVLTLCTDFPVVLSWLYRLWGLAANIVDDEPVMQVVLYVARLLCQLHLVGKTFDTYDVSQLQLIQEDDPVVMVPILRSVQAIHDKSLPIGKDFEMFVEQAVVPRNIDFDDWFSITNLADFWAKIIEWEKRFLTNPRYAANIVKDEAFGVQHF